MDKWCEIFRAGTHIDHHGRKITITENDIDEIIKNFSEKNPDVPIVIGHPALNAPAYGWVEKLKREGNTLLASFKKVIPEFAEWVNKGLYQTRSISLYGDNTLRHIGWLGAQPPAIKGLASFQFAENKDVTIFNLSEADEPETQSDTAVSPIQFAAVSQEEQNYKFQALAEIFSRLREFLIEKIGIDTANQVVPNYSIDDLKRVNTQNMEAVQDYCEPPDKEKILEKNITADANQTIDYAEAKKAVEEKENEIIKLRQELEKERAEKRKTEYTQFAEGLIQSGNITPAQKNLVIDLMEVCTQSGTYDFAEGEDKSVLNRFKTFLKGSKQINFAETATKSSAGAKDITIDFSDPEKASKLIADTAKEKNITEIEAKELLKGGR